MHFKIPNLNPMRKTIFPFLLFSLFFSCKKDKFEPVTSAELSAYVDDFIAEGAKRGVSISKDKLETFLTAKFSEERGENTCGLGWVNFNNQQTQRIEILNSEFCWDSRIAIERENLIFHELGHALLGRDHLNETFENGPVKSLMCSGTEGFCSNFGVYYDNEALRTYYLDELFNSNTPTPAFAEKTTIVRTVFEDQFETGIIGWEEFIEGDPNLFEVTIDSSANVITSAPYAMEIEIKQSVIDEGSFLIVKRFELTNFQECSNLVLKADIRTEGQLDGQFGMTLSLRERLADGSLNRFYLDGKSQKEFNTPTDQFKDFQLELFCIPTRTAVVSVSFSAKSKLPVKIYIDNIRIDLVD